MPSEKQKIGTQGENLACAYLKNKGYILLNQQWHCHFGELDLIMKDNNELVFVEVKMRSSNHFGYPEEMVSREKARRIKKTAWKYLQRYKYFDSFWRFDIVAITGNTQSHEVFHFQDTLHND